MKRFLSGLEVIIVMALMCLNVHAEVKVIEADSNYIIGDNDSKVDARRIATQEAKRKALELAGTYVESLTEVKNYALSKDEVKTYTAGVMETEIVAEEMRGTTEHPEIYIKARCKIDADVLMKQIDRYRENEDLKKQVEASVGENEALRKERDALVAQLAAEKDKTKAEDTRKKLDAVLSKEEANDDTNKVWTNLAPQLEFGDGREINQAELDNSSAVLERAVKINPRNQRARTLLASIYQKRGNIAAAETELRRAIERDPKNPFFHMKLGILLKNKGMYKEALKEFFAVERARPQDPKMLFHTGMTYKAAGNCPQTVSYLKRFLIRTKNNDKPQVMNMKKEALKAAKECGGRPEGKPARQRARR